MFEHLVGIFYTTLQLRTAHLKQECYNSFHSIYQKKKTQMLLKKKVSISYLVQLKKKNRKVLNNV